MLESDLKNPLCLPLKRGVLSFHPFSNMVRFPPWHKGEQGGFDFATTIKLTPVRVARDRAGKRFSFVCGNLTDVCG